MAGYVMTNRTGPYLWALPLAAFVVVMAAVPLVQVAVSVAGDGPRPGGFGQDPRALSRMALSSLAYALGPALLTTAISTLASIEATFNRRFHRIYTLWLTVMLFTNPIFLVLGFSVILAKMPANLSVFLGTSYVIWPLCGLVVQSGFSAFPRDQIVAARALGASKWDVVRSNILQATIETLCLAGFLSATYAMGFYLLPTYVGLGRVVTLGTAINDLVNKTGDWEAAQQLACAMLLLQFLLLGLWRLASTRLLAGRTK